MKKSISILILIAFVTLGIKLKAQSSRYTVLRYWTPRVVPTLLNDSLTWKSFWNINDDGSPSTVWRTTGNALGNNTSFFGSTDNRSWYGYSNNVRRFKLDSLGNLISYAPFSIGDGNSPIANTTNFRFNKPMTGATAFYGMYYDSKIQSDVTGLGVYYQTSASTNSTASTYTCTELRHFAANQGAFGSGSSVINQEGFYADNSINNASERNVGFYGALATNTANTKWNCYMSGTAPNYFNGSVGIATTTPSEKLHVVGNGLFSGTLKSSSGTSTLNSLSIPSQSLATGLSITVDNTGNVFPFIIDGTNGGNAEAIMQGSVNARVTLKNTTANQKWYLSNNTATTGAIPLGFAIGTSSDPNAGIIKTATTGVVTLTSTTNIFGNTTLLSSNSTTLTVGATSGTQAVLTDITIPFQFFPNTSFSPADGDVKFSGLSLPNYQALLTSSTTCQILIPENMEAYKYQITVFNNGGVGSSETLTVSLLQSDGTNSVLSTAVTSTNGLQTFTGTASVSLTSGNSMVAKWIFPTYATNPISTWYNLLIYCRRKP
jgi:hypothetical protein